MSAAVRVVCEACDWRGARVYVPMGQLPGGGAPTDREGFGACPRCIGRLTRWRSLLQKKRDAAAREQFTRSGHP